MALYALTYDVRAKNPDYKSLTAKLEEFHAVRVLQSTWCFNRHKTSASGLRNYFKQFVHEDDGLFVTEIADWATKKADGTPNDLASSEAGADS